MKKNEKIFVVGHQGLVGSAILRALKKRGFENIFVINREELDLTIQDNVKSFFKKYKPDYVFFAAGKTGGVFANDNFRAEFLYENLMMQSNVIHQAYLNEVKKLIFFGCSSIYPKFAPQPMKEEYLLSGNLEPTNEPFAIAKIAGIIMCKSYNRQYGTDFLSVIPTNIYGPNQKYDSMNSLVIPALIRKFHEAKETNTSEVSIWGTGRPSRDFLFSDDLADASIFLMEESIIEEDVLNIASGSDYTIANLAHTIKEVIGFEGKVIFDISKPEGVLVKLQDIKKISALGWKHTVDLKEGISRTYKDLLSKKSKNFWV